MACPTKRKKLNETAKPVLCPVLDDSLIDDTPLIEVYVDTISDPKNISKVVVALNSLLPIPELAHLKRIKGNKVLLFAVSNDVPPNRVYDALREKNFDSSLLLNKIQKAAVAKIPPITREQYTKVHQLWPCNFHGNKYLEKLVTNSMFSEVELKEHVDYMNIAIDVAKYSGKHFQAKRNIGVIVVDPKINSVVAVGYDKTNENPCMHAIMVAVDNVALTQNGGVATQIGDISESKFQEEQNLSGIPQDMMKFLSENYKNVAFGATTFKEKNDIEKPSDGPYLCTGYYVYVTHEPCVMCAMGLIHSRAKRVFYGVQTQSGALGSACKIHTVRDLNHHYEVFGGLLEDTCTHL